MGKRIIPIGFDKWPYGDMHRLNLDWILYKMRLFEDTYNRLEDIIEDIVGEKLEDLVYEVVLGKLGFVNVVNPPAPLEGLDNTGATNNSEKFSVMMRESLKSGNCLFYFPSGTYLMSSLSLLDGVVIMGECRHDTTLLLAAASTDSLITGNCKRTKIANVSLNGNVDAQVAPQNVIDVTATDMELNCCNIYNGYINLVCDFAGGDNTVCNVDFGNYRFLQMSFSGEVDSLSIANVQTRGYSGLSPEGVIHNRCDNVYISGWNNESTAEPLITNYGNSGIINCITNGAVESNNMGRNMHIWIHPDSIDTEIGSGRVIVDGDAIVKTGDVSVEFASLNEKVEGDVVKHHSGSETIIIDDGCSVSTGNVSATMGSVTAYMGDLIAKINNITGTVEDSVKIRAVNVTATAKGNVKLVSGNYTLHVIGNQYVDSDSYRQYVLGSHEERSESRKITTIGSVTISAGKVESIFDTGRVTANSIEENYKTRNVSVSVKKEERVGEYDGNYDSIRLMSGSCTRHINGTDFEHIVGEKYTHVGGDARYDSDNLAFITHELDAQIENSRLTGTNIILDTAGEMYLKTSGVTENRFDGVNIVGKGDDSRNFNGYGSFTWKAGCNLKSNGNIKVDGGSVDISASEGVHVESPKSIYLDAPTIAIRAGESLTWIVPTFKVGADNVDFEAYGDMELSGEDLYVTAKRDVIESNGRDFTGDVGRDVVVHVHQDGRIDIERNYTKVVHGSMTWQVNGSVRETYGSTRDVVNQNDISITNHGDATIQTMGLTHSSSSELILEGQSSVEIMTEGDVNILTGSNGYIKYNKTPTQIGSDGAMGIPIIDAVGEVQYLRTDTLAGSPDIKLLKVNTTITVPRLGLQRFKISNAPDVQPPEGYTLLGVMPYRTNAGGVIVVGGGVEDNKPYFDIDILDLPGVFPHDIYMGMTIAYAKNLYYLFDDGI